MCGASTTAPATRAGKRAACSRAIDAPSLWPKSHGGAGRRCRRRAPASSAGSTSQRLAVHEVEVPGARRPRAAWSGRSPGASRPARGSRGAAHRRSREVLPHGERAQAFVQEDDQRRVRPLRRDPRVLDAHRAAAPVDLDERRPWRRAAPAGGSGGARIPARAAEALDLAGGGLRQIGDELDEARVLVGREPLLHEGLQLGLGRPIGAAGPSARQGLGRARPCSSSSLPITAASSTAGCCTSVASTSKGRDVDAADLEHVVAAAAVGVAAVGVADVLVAGACVHGRWKVSRDFSRWPQYISGAVAR